MDYTIVIPPEIPWGLTHFGPPFHGPMSRVKKDRARKQKHKMKMHRRRGR